MAYTELKTGVYYLGQSDFRLRLFENLFPLRDGVAYNSYLVAGEKTALIDTADASVAEPFMDAVSSALGGRRLDYIVVQHMEPDHSATLQRVLAEYPAARVVMNVKTKQIYDNFCTSDISDRLDTVAEGGVLDLGGKTLTFIMAPMVHWPEVMISYLKEDKILFTADAFGSFGAVDGDATDRFINFDCYLGEMRRYYANIVGKYGTMVAQLLGKAKALDIDMICPLHGRVLVENIAKAVEKYIAWAAYAPESDGVLVAYASMYGNTKNAAFAVAHEISSRGIEAEVMDVSAYDVSELIAAAFKYKHMVLASVTYNAGIYPKMLTFIEDMKALALKNRAFGVIDNGSWAPMAGKLITAALADIKGAAVSANTISVRSAFKPEDEAKLPAFVDALLEAGKGI